MRNLMDLPLPIIVDEYNVSWIYTLYLERDGNNPTLIDVCEIRRKRLCDGTPTDPLFQPYATIPTSIVDTISQQDQSAGIFILDGFIYLSIITNHVNLHSGFNWSDLSDTDWADINREYQEYTPDSFNLYKMTSVDSYGVGVFTLLDSFSKTLDTAGGGPTTTGLTNVSAGSSLDGWIPGMTFAPLWRMSGTGCDGDYRQLYDMTITPAASVSHRGIYGDIQTGPVTFTFSGAIAYTPHYPVGGAFTRFVLEYEGLQHNREADWEGPLYTAVIVNFIPASMTRTDTFGYTMTGTDPGDHTVASSPLYSGSFACRSKAFYVPTFTIWNTFSVLASGVYHLPSGDVEMVVRENDGNMFSFNGVTTAISDWSGLDTVVGVWDSGNALVFKKNKPFINNEYYDLYWVCKPSDTTKRYSIFSRVMGDGKILHVEEIESSQPEVWVDNTFICYLADYGNDRPEHGQFWPRTRPPETFCYQRPRQGQIWPRTR